MIGTAQKWLGTFGYIRGRDGKSYFCHFTSILAPEDTHRALIVGEDVEFDVQDDQRGPRAINVKRTALEGLPADDDAIDGWPT